MKIWAIADLHLSFGTPNKTMDIFGEHWKKHADNIKTHWEKLIHTDDLVLIPGDISWALKAEQALPDLEWIDALPGKKVLLKGNHDYWWPSNKKLEALLPSSIDFIHRKVLSYEGVSISGTRLWDVPDLSFSEIIDFKGEKKEGSFLKEENAKIYQKERLLLQEALQYLDPNASKKIILTHYPPIGWDLTPTEISGWIEEHNVDHVVFGHLHNVQKERSLFGKHNGTHYWYVAADYLNFTPLLIDTV